MFKPYKGQKLNLLKKKILLELTLSLTLPLNLNLTLIFRIENFFALRFETLNLTLNLKIKDQKLFGWKKFSVKDSGLKNFSVKKLNLKNITLKI